MTMEEITNRYHVDPINFLTFHRLKTTVNSFLNVENNIDHPVITNPIQPFHLRILLKQKKGIKNIYSIFNSKKMSQLSLQNGMKN